MITTEQLREQLYDAFKNRAILYYLIYDELRKEIGAEKAEAILSRAIYRRGAEKADALKAFAPANLAGLKEKFLAGINDDGRMFGPEITRDDPEALDIQFHNCPLRDAWIEYGLPEEEIATMCRIAGKIDNGLFESAGFRFWADTWQHGRTGCCNLHLRIAGS